MRRTSSASCTKGRSGMPASLLWLRAVWARRFGLFAKSFIMWIEHLVEAYPVRIHGRAAEVSLMSLQLEGFAPTESAIMQGLRGRCASASSMHAPHFLARPHGPDRKIVEALPDTQSSQDCTMTTFIALQTLTTWLSSLGAAGTIGTCHTEPSGP
jgi:hypothetical protein